METINLNLIPTGARPVLHASQYDKGRQFRANLFEGPAVYTLTGAETISIAVRKPDGHVVTEGITNTSDSYVIIETTEQMTACAGDSFAEVKIEEGGDLLGTLNLILAVEQSPEAGGDPSESFIHNLNTQISNAVADQYDSNNVIFDNDPTTGHGIGYTVTSEGIKTAIDNAIGGLSIPDELNDLSDVDTTTPTPGEALVWDGTKWVNDTVSTVGNLDDLNDVDTTGKQEGDSLRYIGNEWKAKPTTVEMTQAEYNAIVDFTPYENTHIVITDAPNLNATASDIEYSSGVTVYDKINGLSTVATSGSYNDLSDKPNIQEPLAKGNSTADADVLFTTGIYRNNNGMSNCPYNWGVLLVFSANVSNLPTVQFFITSGNDTYTRMNWGAGTWTAWAKLTKT